MTSGKREYRVTLKVKGRPKQYLVGVGNEGALWTTSKSTAPFWGYVSACRRVSAAAMIRSTFPTYKRPFQMAIEPCVDGR